MKPCTAWRLVFGICAAFWLMVVCGVMSLAHAGEYQRVSGNGPEWHTLITRPDNFPNRLRYSFRDDTGFEGVYRIVERKAHNRWVDVGAPNQAPTLVIKGDTLIFESQYNGKTVNKQVFKQIK
ncbi:hypothetical protein BH235_004626 [Salmonella enterica subsp. enterica serovar Javiana]|nr:hypothetical protein [Salmonella enterica subsp. enterica serovar Javiana]